MTGVDLHLTDGTAARDHVINVGTGVVNVEAQDRTKSVIFDRNQDGHSIRII
jgi:hypothetical protein